MRFFSGQPVFALCAKVDPFGVSDEAWENSEPCIDTSSFSWLSMVVMGVGEKHGDVCVRMSDGSVTEYEERFLLSWEEMHAMRLPPTPR